MSNKLVNKAPKITSGAKLPETIYHLTQSQLDLLVRNQIEEKIQQAKIEAADEATNNVLALLLVLPMEVLMDFYWQKSYAKKIPEFINHVLDYYNRWEDGELNLDEMKADLKKWTGIELECAVEEAI